MQIHAILRCLLHERKNNYTVKSGRVVHDKMRLHQWATSYHTVAVRYTAGVVWYHFHPCNVIIVHRIGRKTIDVRIYILYYIEIRYNTFKMFVLGVSVKWWGLQRSHFRTGYTKSGNTVVSLVPSSVIPYPADLSAMLSLGTATIGDEENDRRSRQISSIFG